MLRHVARTLLIAMLLYNLIAAGLQHSARSLLSLTLAAVNVLGLWLIERSHRKHERAKANLQESQRIRDAARTIRHNHDHDG